MILTALNPYMGILKVVGPPVLAALVVGSCTASHFRLKINNMELEWQAQVEQAKTKAALKVAENQRIAQEVQDELHRKNTDLNARYATASQRLLRAQAEARSLRTASLASPLPNGAAQGDGLPVGSGEAPALITLPVDGTVALFKECDVNTQKLLGWQLWYDRTGQKLTGETK